MKMAYTFIELKHKVQGTLYLCGATAATGFFFCANDIMDVCWGWLKCINNITK